MKPTSPKQLATLVQAFVALCLGSSSRLVWMDQADAAAYSDGEKLYLPAPAGEEGELELLFGLAMREVARFKHSDSARFGAAATEVTGYAAAIEDARIKHEVSQEYKGAPALFDAATKIVSDISAAALSRDDADPEMAKQYAIWFSANDAYLGTKVSGDASKRMLQIALDAGQDMTPLHTAIGLSQASPYLGSTDASVVCGTRIHALLHPQLPDPPPQAQQSGEAQSGTSECQDGGATQSGTAAPNGDGGSQGGPDDNAMGAASSRNDGPGSCDGQSPDGRVETGATQDQKQGNPQQQSTLAGGTPSNDLMSNALAMLKGFDHARSVSAQKGEDKSCEEPATALLEAMRDALAALNAMEAIYDIQVSEVGESVGDAAGSSVNDGSNGAANDDELMLALGSGAGGQTAPVTYAGSSQLDAVPSRLVNVLLRELHDKRPTRVLRRESGSDVDAANVWKLRAIGDTRVFRKVTPSSGVDAAIHILLDRSTSMRRRLTAAASSANAFAMALQRISGVQTALSVFPSTGRGVTEQLLRFRQNPAQVKAKLAALDAKGGTPTDIAITEAAVTLLNARVHKRVIVLITDGKPDDWDFTLGAIADASRKGIDVIGVGIGQEAVIEHLLPGRSITIGEVQELPQALERLFKNNLSSLLAA